MLNLKCLIRPRHGYIRLSNMEQVEVHMVGTILPSLIPLFRGSTLTPVMAPAGSRSFTLTRYFP
jgi:hypothetical protein